MVRLHQYRPLIMVLFLAIGEAAPPNSTKKFEVFTTTAVTASTVALVLVMVLAVALLGNTLICVAFYRSTNLRSVTNVFIVSLAVTDILVAIVSIPIWLVIKNDCINNSTAYDPMLLAFWRRLDILFSTASILNLCAKACDRYIAITSPLRYTQIITKTRTIIALICLWSYSTIIATINLHEGKYYPVPVFIVSFLLPLIVMIYSYSRIFLAAIRQVRRIQSIRQAEVIGNGDGRVYCMLDAVVITILVRFCTPMAISGTRFCAFFP